MKKCNLRKTEVEDTEHSQKRMKEAFGWETFSGKNPEEAEKDLFKRVFSVKVNGQYEIW